jgi:hypothetical protein
VLWGVDGGDFAKGNPSPWATVFYRANYCKYQWKGEPNPGFFFRRVECCGVKMAVILPKETFAPWATVATSADGVPLLKVP